MGLKLKFCYDFTYGFENKFSFETTFISQKIEFGPFLSCVLEQHKSVQMGLKLKFCYDFIYGFVDKILFETTFISQKIEWAIFDLCTGAT